MAPLRRSRCVIAFLSLLAAAPRARSDEALPREWNQAQGNAQHTGFVDVAPIKVPPQEAWRQSVGELVADPVVSQGKLYALARDGRTIRLVVLEAGSGAVVVKAQLDPVGDVAGLAAVDGLVVVAGASKLVTCRLAGSHVRWEKSVAGAFVGAPTCVPGGALVEAEGGDLQAIDLTEGRVIGHASGYGAPACVVHDGVDVANRFVDAAALGAIDAVGNLRLATFTTNLGCGASGRLTSGGSVAVAPIGCDEKTLSGGLLARVPAGAKGVTWYAWIRRRPASSVLCETRLALPVPLELPPAIRDGVVYGFDVNGVLVAIDVAERRLLPFIGGSDLPAGAAVAPPTIARDVLYLGNWAVEIGSRRVLWCRPELKTSGPAIPVGDEQVVVATPDGTLVALSSRAVASAPKRGAGKAGAPPDAPAGAAARAAAPTAAPLLLPGSTPGLVLADGRFVAGKVTPLDAGRWRLEPEGALAQELDAAAVAVADPGSVVKLQGDQYPLFRACMAALNAQHVAVLVSSFEKWKELKFFEESRRLVDEARRFGLPAARADQMVASIAGRKSTTVGNADVQRKKCRELEAAARAKIAESVVAAAKWCADRDAPVAATAVRLHQSDFVPDVTIAPDAIAAWMPSIFPFNGTPREVARTWANWAEPLLPSGARFFKPDARITKALARTIFSDSVTVRTDHIVLYSLELDPKIVGSCLARAEATFRTLKPLLGKSPSGARPDDVLNVFLYSTRAQYVSDTSGGGTPPTWSAGFYSPAQHLSRFYTHQEGDATDPLGRSLYTVMAHELTHHYCDRVWNPASTPAAAPGFWMEEGFAEFVAGQQVEMDRLGGGLDDSTVLSLDLAAAAMKERRLLPFEFLLGLDLEHFISDLDGGEFGPVQARHTLGRLMMDRRTVFYVESAALTFFVMNRFGAKGREVYIDWYARFLRAQPRAEPWKDLGFAELADFEKAFRDFLAGL